MCYCSQIQQRKSSCVSSVTQLIKNQLDQKDRFTKQIPSTIVTFKRVGWGDREVLSKTIKTAQSETKIQNTTRED